MSIILAFHQKTILILIHLDSPPLYIVLLCTLTFPLCPLFVQLALVPLSNLIYACMSCSVLVLSWSVPVCPAMLLVCPGLSLSTLSVLPCSLFPALYLVYPAVYLVCPAPSLIYIWTSHVTCFPVLYLVFPSLSVSLCTLSFLLYPLSDIHCTFFALLCLVLA